MVLTATGLIVLGGVSALLGLRLVTILLPILGFVSGLMVGFSGVQAVFGTGAVSLTIAIIMSLIVGIIMAVLSYLFYEIALVVLAAVIGASVMSYLGIAIGLEANGVVVFMLAVAGAIIGFIAASNPAAAPKVAVAVTSLLGSLLVLGGAMLLVGEVSLDQLYERGIIRTVLDVVDQEILWLLAWLGGSLMAISVQTRVGEMEQSATRAA